MLFACLDGSGTHAKSPVVAISGFIADEPTWIEFHDKWYEVLNDPKRPNPLNEFHMVDCVHADHEFTGWSFAERLILYGDLCQLISASRVIPIGSSVVADAFVHISPQELALLSLPTNRLGTPLDICFHGIIQQLIHRVNTIGNGETLSIVFDNEPKNREENFTDFCQKYASEYFLGDLFYGYSFADSKKLAPLQAADLLAYGTNQLAHFWAKPPTSEPYFPVIPPLWKMLIALASEAETSPYGTVFGKDELKNLVEKVKRGEKLPKKL